MTALHSVVFNRKTMLALADGAFVDDVIQPVNVGLFAAEGDFFALEFFKLVICKLF